MKVLIVEDEKKVLSFIQKGLTQKEMSVDAATDLDELFSSLLTTTYDIIVLDRILKGEDSIHSLAKIRKKSGSAKILILSALSDVEDKIEGLDSGADDYLSKPFHVSELIARIRALSRRETLVSTAPNTLSFMDLTVKLDSQKVERSGRKIELTPKEYKVLVSLLKKPGKVYSKIEIINSVWDMQHFPESNVVEVVMNHLRNKINKGFDKPLIHSKRGTGYWLGEENL